MNAGTAGNRALASQGIIVLAVCVGGYMVLVDPARRQAAAAAGQAESIAAQVREAESLRDQVPMLSAALEKTKKDVKDIAESGKLARDERELFAAVMAMADGTGIRVEQLSPAKTATVSADSADARDTVVAYSITATGNYGQVAAFLRGLRTGLGFTNLRSVRLTPTPEENAPVVRAVIETEHFAFDPAPAAPAADPKRSSAAGGA